MELKVGKIWCHRQHPISFIALQTGTHRFVHQSLIPPTGQNTKQHYTGTGFAIALVHNNTVNIQNETQAF
jgi:hypothetical protein